MLEPIDGAKLKPTVEKMVNQRKSFYKKRNDLLHGMRRLTFMRENVPLPSPHDQYIKQPPRAPVIFRLNQTVSGAIAKEWPSWEVNLKNDDEDAQRRGSDWANGAFHAACSIAGRPLFWKYIAALVGDGSSIFKVQRIPWEDMPDRRDGEDDEAWNKRMANFWQTKPKFPFKTSLIDTLTFLPPTGTYADEGDCIEYGTRGTFDTLRAMRIIPKDSSLSEFKMLPEGVTYPINELPTLPATCAVAEVWSDDYVDVIIRGKHFFFKNPYGFKPYVFVPGMPTQSFDPTLDSVPVAFTLQYMQPWLNVLLGIKASWAARAGVSYAVSPAVAPGADPTIQGDISFEDFQTDRIYHLPPGASVNRMEGAFAGQELREAIQLFMEITQNLTLPPVVSGFISSRTPGLTMSAAVQQATAMLQPLVDNAQYGLASLMKLYFRFVKDVIRGPIVVSGMEFLEAEGKRRKKGEIWWGPTDVKNVDDILVTLSTDSLQDLISKGTHAAQMMSAGLWSEKRSMLFSGVKDVREERRERERERLAHNPIVQQYVDQKILSEEEALRPIVEETMGMGEAVEGMEGAPPAPMPEEMGIAAPPNIGGPAPRGGGTPAGFPKQPGGMRQVRQPRPRLG